MCKALRQALWEKQWWMRPGSCYWKHSQSGRTDRWTQLITIWSRAICQMRASHPVLWSMGEEGLLPNIGEQIGFLGGNTKSRASSSQLGEILSPGQLTRAQLLSGVCIDCSPPGFSAHGKFPGKNTGAGCHFLLQGIFPTQRLNPRLLHWQADSLPLHHLEKPMFVGYVG